MNMTTQEKRFFRRELINKCLHAKFTSVRLIKIRVRLMELRRYEQELKVYVQS